MLIDKASNLPIQAPETTEFQEEGNTAVVVIGSPQRTYTKEQALAKANVDETIWEVERYVVNSWEMGAKGPDGRILVTPLFQVKMWLRRKAPKYVQDAIHGIVADWKPPKPKSIRKKAGRHLIEFSLYDAHFGSLVYNPEKNGLYNISDCKSIFVNSVKLLSQEIQFYRPDQIVLPVGNDFFHVDNWKHETHKGTKLEHVEEKFPEVFRAGWEAVDEVIMNLREYAPVEVIWVPGNHDYTTSFYLVELLRARYKKDRRVSFDVTDSTRKYRQYGVNLLGYTHGDKVKLANLPLIMAAESPKEWGDTKYRAWRTGHRHRKQQLSFYVGDSMNGVRVDVMPSLCPTNEWHHQNGYVENIRAAEMWVWDAETGYRGHTSQPIMEM